MFIIKDDLSESYIDSEEEKNIINKEKEIKYNLNIVNNVCEFENKNIFERYNDNSFLSYEIEEDYNDDSYDSNNNDNDNEKFPFSQENKLKLNNNSINNNIDDLLNDIDKKKNNNYSKNENSNLSIINNI